MRIGDLCAKDEYLKIYDPTKQQIIKECETYVDAEIYTGIQASILRNAVKYKTRRFSPFLNKEIAIRVGVRKQL